jgi:hypothetical protein
MLFSRFIPLVALLALPSLGLAIPLPQATPRVNAPIEMTLLMENGDPQSIWSAHGDQYVISRPGGQYGLRFANPTNELLRLSVGVDGLDVWTGQRWSQQSLGIVLRPHQAIVLTHVRDATGHIIPLRYCKCADSGYIAWDVYRERSWIHGIPRPPRPHAMTLVSGPYVPISKSSLISQTLINPDPPSSVALSFQGSQPFPNEKEHINYAPAEEMVLRGFLPAPK